MLFPAIRNDSQTALRLICKHNPCRLHGAAGIPLQVYCRRRLPLANSTLARWASSSSKPSLAGRSSPKGVRVGILFLALSIIGLGTTSLGLYSHYSSVRTFPTSIRTELRSALRCKVSQDYRNSNKFFRQAWEKATSPELAQELGLLKITGIAISWAEMLEEASRRSDSGSVTNALGEAYSVLEQAYSWARNHLNEDGGRHAKEVERMRVVAMAVKLAEMGEGDKNYEQDSEKQLTWAVEEVLRLSTSRPSHTPSSALSPDNENFLVAELGLPSWVSKTDLGGTLEALGNLYARKRKVEYAMPLYLQTISLLLPPPDLRKSEPSTGEKCHAATIMNNLSSLLATSPPTNSDVSATAQATAWASKASSIASMALASASSVDVEADSCKAVITVALYNLGMLALLEGKKEEAGKLLADVVDKAKQWKLIQAEIRAKEVLENL